MLNARKKRIIKRAVIAAGIVVALGGITLVSGYFYLKADLPRLRSIEDYAPSRATKIYSDDGQLVGELFRERRTVVPIEAVPEHVVHAFLAAEDASFYHHEGIDYMGILRAAIKNLRPGSHQQGASTITQQTVKTMVLGPERSYVRKMREAILARELEQLLSKDEILHLYLNQIYFGSGAYGVEEAAQTYFGKSVRELDLGEAALLAAIPKNPSHYTPAANPKAAKQRQIYVLEQMLANGWASAEEVKRAEEQPVPAPPKPTPYLGKGPHYVEHVKKLLIERFGRELAKQDNGFDSLPTDKQEARIAELGEQYVLTRGLTVYTGMNAHMQEAAHLSVRLGLERFTRQQGYPGPRGRIEVDKLAHVKNALHAAFDARLEKLSEFSGNSKVVANTIWDLSRIDAQHVTDEAKLKDQLYTASLEYGVRVVALVDKVDSVADEVWVDLGSARGHIAFSTMSWARHFAGGGWSAPPHDPAEVLRAGDLIVVDITGEPQKQVHGQPTVELELVPEPQVEGALVAIDPHTRMVRAIVGGYRAEMGGFNRATQAKRQAGSAFKPLVYAAGLAQRAITSASTCPDSPVVYHDRWTGKAWKPENYEDGRYDGNITYRTALMRSKNTCSVKLIDKIGPAQVIELAHAAGIKEDLPENLTLALGTGDVTPLELANAYSTIASGGLYADPIFIRKIADYDGTVLYESHSEPQQVLEPAVAFVLTEMMRSVVEEGTATRALVLDRPLAGKTGTSQESRNVWFSGFSAELVATVWVGFDDNSPMGHATGSSAALPAWIDFMGRALSGVPVRAFTPPPEVVFVRVDATTGQPTDDPSGIEMAFVAGTEPSRATQALPSIFIEDEDGPFPPN